MAKPSGVAAGRILPAMEPGAEHRALQAFIGKWITQGETTASADAPAMKILASDVYEWVPGGFFVQHTAYGRIGEMGVGGIEIIGYDQANGNYRSQFFDSQGNSSISSLSFREGVWTWQGERTRCNSVVSEAGRVHTAHHERSDDGVNWVSSMVVRLTRIA